MERAPAAHRDLFCKVVPLANRESYQALRVHVREWTLAQRTSETPDTSAPMGIGQVKGTKGKGKKGKRKEKGQERQR